MWSSFTLWICASPACGFELLTIVMPRELLPKYDAAAAAGISIPKFLCVREPDAGLWRSCSAAPASISSSACRQRVAVRLDRISVPTFI